MYMAEKYSHANLDIFIHEWKRIFDEKPEDIIFSMNFRNLIIYSYRRLSRDKKEDLLKYSIPYLRYIVQNENIETKIWKEYIGIDYIKKIESGRFSEIKPILEDISNKLSGNLYLNFLLDELGEELVKEEISREYLIILSKLIISENINKFYFSELKNIFENVLSLEYTKLFVNRNKNRFLENTKLESELYSLIKHVLNNIEIDKNLENFDVSTSIFDLESSYYWKRKIHLLFNEIKEHLIEIVLELPNDTDKDTINIDKLCKSKIILENSKNVYLEFISITITELIRKEIKNQLTNEKNTQISSFIDQFTDDIDFGFINRMNVYYDKKHYADKKNPAVREVIKDILPILLGEIIAQLIIDEINIDELKLKNFIEIIINKILIVKFINIDTNDKCENIIYNQKNQDEIGACIIENSKKLTFKPIVNNIIKNEIFDNCWTSFSGQFIDKFIHNFGNKSHFKNLPWHQVEKTELKFLINQVFKKLTPNESEWTFIFVIDNISPEGQKWKFSNILFYDSMIWNFTEGFLFPNKNNNKTYARITVKTETQYMAKQIAFNQVQKAIDTITFAHSVNNSFGINPSIENVSFVVKNGKVIERDFKSPKSSFAIHNNVIKDKIIENSKNYSDLLEKQNTNPEALNDLQKSFIKAVGWYRKGRWEEDNVHAFLNYWIALEHIFAEGDKSKIFVLLERLPNLHITWRNISRSWVLRQYLRQIMIFIEQDKNFKETVNKDRELIEWNKHDYVLLNPENLKRLINYTENLAVKDYIQNFIDDELSPDQIEAYKIITEDMRLQFKFKVYLLYSLRNDIVHGAVDYYPNIELYFELIKDIIEGILLKMFSTAVDESSKSITLENLALELEKPFTNS